MTIRFLLDENLSPRLVRALKRARPEIDVLRVGDAGAPPLGTKDPDLLVWCDQAQRLLVTNDRTTMPVHLDAHYAAGRQHWGMVWVHHGTTIGQMTEALHLIWEASSAEDWRNRTIWIPF